VLLIGTHYDTLDFPLHIVSGPLFQHNNVRSLRIFLYNQLPDSTSFPSTLFWLFSYDYNIVWLCIMDICCRPIKYSINHNYMVFYELIYYIDIYFRFTTMLKSIF